MLERCTFLGGVILVLVINNKFYTWEQIVGLYPDKWVVVENAKLTNGGFIQEGELIAVGDSKEIDDFVVECYKSGRKVDYQRTTDSGSVGVVYVEGIEIRVE